MVKLSEHEFMDIFGDNLRDSMIIFGIGQNELARRTGITKACISQYVNKKRLRTLKNLINIAVALHCNLDDLVPTYDHIYGASRR